jgi:P27 family predicted phage terminase small subunit
MRGRKPVPLELQRARGNPGHRELPQGVQIAGKSPLDIPALTPEAEDVWNELVPQLEAANLLDRADSLTLEALCILVATARYARNQIESTGYTTKHRKTGVDVVSPWVRIERDSWKQAIAIGEQFGLSPMARTRLGLAVLKGRSLLNELKGLDDET